MVKSCYQLEPVDPLFAGEFDTTQLMLSCARYRPVDRVNLG